MNWKRDAIIAVFLCGVLGMGTMLRAGNPAAAAGNPADPSSSCYRYVGRIDIADPAAPKFYYAGSYIQTVFTGTSLKATFDEKGDWWGSANHVGFVIDGGDLIDLALRKSQPAQVLDVVKGLTDREHTLTIIKQCGPGGGASTLVFHGLTLDPGKQLLPPTYIPKVRIEVYGDSVTEGAGALSPEGKHHTGNSGWDSYANVAARLLDADVANLGIGGLSVLDGTGYYNSGKTELQTTFDKLRPYPPFTSWDFSRFTPDILIFACGVNDAKGGFDDLPKWKQQYKQIIRDIHARHVGVTGRKIPIVMTVGPLSVWPAYDNVKAVCEELRAEGLDTHYFRCSFDLAFHPNRPESARMGEELARFIRTDAQKTAMTSRQRVVAAADAPSLD